MDVAELLVVSIVVLFLIRALRKVLPFLRDFRHAKLVLKNIPSPPALPLLGHALFFAGDPEDVYDKIQTAVHELRPTMAMWIGHIPIVVITDPADYELVMTHPKMQAKSEVYAAVEKMMGRGLVTLKGEDYRRHRKAITPSLHLDILHDFVEIFDEESVAFADTLGKLADAESVFDVKPLCGYCANSTVCRSVFSSSVSDEECNRSEFLDIIMPGQAMFMYRIWRPWLLNDWLFSWTRQYPEYVRIKHIVRNFVSTLITKKSEDIARNGPQNQTRKRKAFLDHMLQSADGSVLTKEELFGEMETISTVASGSSMDALAFLCYTLALRPDMQQKVQKEVDDVFGPDLSRRVEPSDLPHLQFTERFIKECMRYFAVVPVFGRYCPENIKLPSGYTVPKGAQIAFFLPQTHMNPEYFPEPKVFNPDRWLPENCRGRHPYSFVPFSAGTRNCIGQRYAMMFMKTTVANLARRVEFLPAPDSPKRLEDVKLKMELTLSVRGEANIRVRRRSTASA